MYTIGYIIYGLPLKAAEILTEDKQWSEELEDAFDSGENGFHSPYSGASDLPAAFGVNLGSFNECVHHIDIKSLPLEPTDEQREEYAGLLSALSPSLQEELTTNFGEPRVFILWGTS